MPFPSSAPDLDLAAVSLDELVDDGETETSSSPGFFGREERLEHASLGCRVDARAVVADAKARPARAISNGRLGGDLESSARRHGVASVQDEVDEHELELGRIREHGRRPVTRRPNKLDVIADDRRKKGLDRDEKVVEVDGSRLEGLRSARR